MVGEIQRGAVIGRNCNISSHAFICAGVNAGRKASVRAGAVVRHDVADYAIVAGVPAGPIRVVHPRDKPG